MLRGFVICLFLSAIMLGEQQGTTSPCDEKPPTQRQMNDCAAFQYGQADARLNNVYAKAMQYMTNDKERAQKQGDQRQIEYEKTAVESLKQAERAWLTYRDLQCRAADSSTKAAA
jgi:uncharacterized protein YecT (DUF1311 family)